MIGLHYEKGRSHQERILMDRKSMHLRLANRNDIYPFEPRILADPNIRSNQFCPLSPNSILP